MSGGEITWTIITGLIIAAIIGLWNMLFKKKKKEELFKAPPQNTIGDENKNTVQDSSIQAEGDVHVGDTHIHQPNKPETKCPKELTDKMPSRSINEITGRGKELKALRKCMEKQHRALLLNGMGGIGKTTLAEAYVSAYYDTYKHIAWVNLDRKKEVFSAFASAKGLIAHLNVETEGATAQDIFLQIMRGLKAIEGHPNLLVLDNAPTDLKEYTDYLPGAPQWHVLATARETIGGFEPFPVDELSEEDAFKLFQQYCSTLTDEGAIKVLLKSIDYHTLTIELLAKTTEYQKLSMEQVKEAIPTDQESGTEIEHSGHEKIDRVYSYLQSIFEITGLNDNERWLLKQFVCLPPQDMDFEMLKGLIQPEATKRDGGFGVYRPKKSLQFFI